jgi:hypothetical protein
MWSSARMPRVLPGGLHAALADAGEFGNYLLGQHLVDVGRCYREGPAAPVASPARHREGIANPEARLTRHGGRPRRKARTTGRVSGASIRCRTG